MQEISSWSIERKYSVGFMFDENYKHVVLIRKNRPAWQRGLLNGVGGHIEEGENPYQAMVREFYEETGVTHEDWKQFASIIFDGAHVSFFMTCGVVWAVTTTTDEEIGVFNVSSLSEEDTIPNLQWLIPMAVSMKNERISEYRIYGANSEQS